MAPLRPRPLRQLPGRSVVDAAHHLAELPPRPDGPTATISTLIGIGSKAGLDCGEPVGAAGSFLCVIGQEEPEVQLDNRRDADGRFDIRGRITADQHGSVEDGSHLSNGSIRPELKALKVLFPGHGGAGPRHTRVSKVPLTHRRL